MEYGGLQMKIFMKILVGLSLLLCACTTNNQGQPSKLPELHMIPTDESMGTLNDEAGADAFQNMLDHPDSRYYTVNDYYNMESKGSLHILSHFSVYQQTTEYSCGCSSALMALNHLGIHDYNEMDICRLAKTDTSKGSTVEGLVSFFNSAGLRTDAHADTKKRFDSIEECEQFLIKAVDDGAPVLADWVDWSGHWQVIIGIDTINTESPYDDVLIMADPYDVTDHYQDGYYVVPFGRFFDMWREGLCAEKDVVYEQPFIVVYPHE